jgi:chromosome segregation ATPase
MSQRQKEFIAEASGRIRNLHRIEEGFKFRWYAVSQEDAKKMTQAFIDVWNSKVDAKLQPYLKRRKELEEKIADIKKKLPEKESKLDADEANYQKVKNITHEFSPESDAVMEAKQTILEMIKKLDALEIELAGIRGKLKAIEEYRQRKYAKDGKNFSKETLDKLDQMFVEQMIELRSVEARKKAALQIRKREKDFYNLYSQLNELRQEVSSLNRSLIDNERDLLEIEEKLANPTPEMLPPKVFQNKVAIYPVR